jgi:hypothetical protein
MDTFSSSRFSTHMRDNLLNPVRQGFRKGVSGFNDLPISYKYAIGLGATVGVGVLGVTAWCAFQKGKPVEPTSSNSEIDVSQLEQDERTARIDSFFVGQNEGFNKFQEIHDIGPTEVLQSRTHKWILRNYLGNFFLNEVSLLIRQGANPFIPMFRDGGINAFVSIAQNIKPEFLLPMLCDEYRSKKGESVRVFSDEEIKDGIKQSLVHLFETTEFSQAFQHILASLLDPELKQTKPGLVFTSQDWEDVVVYAADVEIVHDVRYKTCLDIFLKETDASASSSSSSSSCNHSAKNMGGSSSSSSSSSAPTISLSLPTSIVGGIRCAIAFERYDECGVVGYIVRLGKNKYFCSSSRGGLADFVRSKLVKDFALLYVTEDIVEKSLEEAGIYNQWDAFCEEKKAEMLRNKKIRQLPKIAIECGLPKSVDDISASGNTLVLINAINVRITLSYDGYSRSFIVPYTFEYVRKSDFTSFKNELQEKFHEICDIHVSSDEIDTYLLQNGFYTSLEQSFGQLEELTYYDKTDMPVQHIISFYVDRHYPRNTLSHVPIISETDSQEEPLSNAAKTYCYYETLKEV